MQKTKKLLLRINRDRDLSNMRNREYFYYESHPYVCLAAEFHKRGPIPLDQVEFSVNQNILERLEGVRNDHIQG